MNSTLLHYVHDPLCGWCYAASALIDDVLASGFDIELHGGALWEQQTRLSAEKRLYIGQRDERIAELTGQVFGASYLARLGSDADMVFWSRPCLAAILGAGAQKRGADLVMLKAIQSAHYLHGLPVVDTGVLLDLAAKIGLDTVLFSQSLLGSEVDQHIHESRSWMSRFGLRGFPGFILGHGGRYVQVSHERHYARPSDFVHALHVAALQSDQAARVNS